MINETQLPLESIVRDNALQIRNTGKNGGLNAGTVEAYRTIVRNHLHGGGEPFPPVTVARLGQALLLVDGFHRFRAHELEGAVLIAAEVRDVRTMAEARWLAAAGNLRHGLPLKRAERKKAFSAFMRAGGYLRASATASRQRTAQRRGPKVMTLSEIANTVAVSKSAVRKWMKADFASVYRNYYQREEDVCRTGEHLAPYSPYKEDEAADIAKRALVSAGAVVGDLKEGVQREAFAGALAQLVQSVVEIWGVEALREAIEAGGGEGWYFRPPPPAVDF